MPGADITCILCQDGHSDVPNEIVLCDNCNHGYHQKCHKPKIPNKVLRPDVPWLCRKCVFATTTRPGGAARKGAGAQALLAVKKVLPYQLKSLIWDSFHQRNKQDLYCYCGGPGEWYVKMLQCRRCLQWFHEACLQCLDYPLLSGDQFFIFVCALCNYGKEFLHRLELSWADIAHLVLFGLTLQQRKRFFDLDSEIIPFINASWVQLQLSEPMRSIPENARRAILLKTFNKNTSRFKSGSEIKKKMLWYSLRISHPPPPPLVDIPRNGPITDEVLSKAKASKRCTNESYLLSLSDQSEWSSKTAKISDKKNRNSSKILKVENSSSSSARDMSSSSSTSSNTRIYSLKRTRDKIEEVVESDSEDTSSIGTLDSFIPKPTNFEGKNNPFRVQDRKNGKRLSEKRAKRAQTSAEPLLRPPTLGQAKTSSESDAESLIEKRIVSPVTATKIPIRDLKSSVSSYFGAENRIARGEKCNILARRQNSLGQMQYLIEWEGIS